MTATEQSCKRPPGVIIKPWQQMVSSCTGALLTSVLVTPLDVVKIRLQAQKKPSAFSKGKCFLYCNGLMDHMCCCYNVPCNSWYKKPIPIHFSGTLDAFIKIVKYEGVTSLWSGLPPTLLMAVPATVIYFTVYEQLKAMFQTEEKFEWWKPMVAGSGARVWAVSVISPMEMVRTKMQSEQLTYRAVIQALCTTIRHHGPLSLWHGLGPTLLRDVPFSGLYWLTYETLKAEMRRATGTPELPVSYSFVAGACAGTAAAVVTLPFDVIKTHRQIELGQQLSGTGGLKASSTWILINRLYRADGFGGIFAGLVPRIVKVAPACAIMISSYEYFKTLFYQRNLQELCSAPNKAVESAAIVS